MKPQRGCPTLGVRGWVLGSPMPKGLQCHYGRGHLHFLTFSCYRRLPLLKPSAPGMYCSRACASAHRVRILACWICGHAGARASPDQRAKQRHTFHGVADVETAGFQEIAEATTQKPRGTIPARLSRTGGEAESLLAGALLRLQRVHQPEEAGETGLHAPQSVVPWIGKTPERLAVEQLAILRNARAGACTNRSHPGMKQRKNNPRPTLLPEGGAPNVILPIYVRGTRHVVLIEQACPLLLWASPAIPFTLRMILMTRRLGNGTQK